MRTAARSNRQPYHGNAEVRAACGTDGQVDTAILFRSAADKIATGLVTAIYPIQVAAVQSDGVIVLNYGEGAIVPGAVMGLCTKGAPITIRRPATSSAVTR